MRDYNFESAKQIKTFNVSNDEDHKKINHRLDSVNLKKTIKRKDNIFLTDDVINKSVFKKTFDEERKQYEYVFDDINVYPFKLILSKDVSNKFNLYLIVRRPSVVSYSTNYGYGSSISDTYKVSEEMILIATNIETLNRLNNIFTSLTNKQCD